MTDHDIIEHLKNDRYSRAVKGLYSSFSSVKQHILFNSGKKEDAEDIFQEALFILYKKVKAGDLVLTSSVATYIGSIARNLWYAELRKRGKEHLTNGFPHFEEEVAAEEEIRFRQAEMAFNLLGEKCRELLLLFYFKKKSMQEVSKILGFSNEKVAKNQKYRCLEKAKDNYLQLVN